MEILAICSKFPEGFTQSFKDSLEKVAAGHSVRYIERCNPIDKELRIKYFSEADVIVGHFAPFSDLQYCKNLKLLLLDIAGADGYALHPMLPENTVVCNASGSYGPLLAEHAVTLLLSVMRNIPYYAHNMDNCLWEKKLIDSSVEGKNVFVLGMGDIGTTIASYLRPMLGSGKIIGVRRTKRPVEAPFDDCISLDELDSRLPSADIIMCALPGTPETNHILSHSRFGLMKSSAVIVNVGRGSLIDTDALCDALDNGQIAAAGLDVTDPEPLPADHRLWRCKNVLVTPHAGGASLPQESPTYDRAYAITLSNLEHFLKNESLHHVVSKELGY